jgi:hypothetical protein
VSDLGGVGENLQDHCFIVGSGRARNLRLGDQWGQSQ